jgi:hypothetical protein
MLGVEMASPELERVFQLVDRLNKTDRQALFDYLAHKQSKQPADHVEDPVFSDDEIREMLTPKPKKGREIVEEGLKSGAIGSWGDMNVSD